MPESISLHLRVLTLLLAMAPCVAIAAESAASDNARLRGNHWALQALDGKPVGPPAGQSSVHVVLHGDSQRLSGFAGCNRLQGRYTQRGTQLVLSAIATTRKVCAAPQMDQERQLIELLGAVDAYRIEGKTLSLLQGDVVRLTLTSVPAR